MIFISHILIYDSVGGKELAKCSPFPVVFEKKCDKGYNAFIENYDPAVGFRIVCTNKEKESYCLYLNSYKFVCHPWVTNTIGQTGFRINVYEPIEQRDTVTLATKGITIKHLSEENIYYFGDRHIPSFTHAGFKAVAAALDSRVANIETSDYYTAFWEYHREIITQKREYEKLRLMAIEYHSIEADSRVEGGNTYTLTVDPLSEIVRKNEEMLKERGVAKPEPDDEADVESPEALQKRYLDKLTRKMNVKLPSSIEGGLGILAVTKGFEEKDGRWLLTVCVADGQNISTTDIKAEGTLTERLNPEYKHKDNTITEIMQNEQAWENMNQVVTLKGCEPIEIVENISLNDNDRFTDNQVEAINKAINTNDFLLIQGPPGTGKTTIIAKMVDNFVGKNQKVLICSKNNLAVDNVLDKWIEINQKRFENHLCIRLGDEDSIKIDSVKDYTSEKITARVQKLIYGKSAAAHKQLLNSVESELEELNKFDSSSIDVLDLARLFFEISIKLRPLSAAYDSFLHFPKKIADIGLPIDLGNYWYKAQAAREAIVLCQDELFKPLLKAFYSKTSLPTEQIDKIANAYRRALQTIAIATDENDISGVVVRLMFNHDDKEIPKKRAALSSLISQLNKYQSKMSNLYAFCGNPVFKGDDDPQRGEKAYDKIIRMSHENLQLTFDELISEVKKQSFEKRFVLSRIRDILAEWHRELLDNGSTQLEETLVKESIKIIGATCMGVNSDPNFKDTVYDVVIVDEAGQIPLHDIAVPLSKAKKVILIGDHLQLPPMSEEDFVEYYEKTQQKETDSDNNSETENIATEMNQTEKYQKEDLKKVFSVSLFEKLYRSENIADTGARIMLNRQYRMHPHIADFISKEFYNGEYKNGVEKDAREISIAGFSDPIYFFDTKNCEDREEQLHNPGCSNNLEAEICSDILIKLIPEIEAGNYKIRKNATLGIKDAAGNVVAYDIGVISGYDKQVNLIKEKTLTKLQSVCGYTEEKALEIMTKFKVSSVDSFQGRDNEIILFSMTRSNKKGKIGFLRDVRRLNVAMTRAKSMLIMIGDTDTLIKSRQKAEHDETKFASSYYVALKKYCEDMKYYHLK